LFALGTHRRFQRIVSASLAFLLVISFIGYLPLSNFADARSMSPVTYDAGTSPYNVALGDLDGDGLQDVAVTNFTEGTVGIYYQQAGGTLGAMVTLDSPPAAYNQGSFLPNPYGLNIVDFDRDGFNDLLVTNEFQHQAWVYRQNDTTNNLYLYQIMDTPPFETHPYSSPYSVDAGDIDGDLYPEIVVANYYWIDGSPSDKGSVGLYLNRYTADQNLHAVDFVDTQAGWISGYHSVFNTLTGGWNPITSTGLWSAQYLPFDDMSGNDVNTSLRGVDFIDRDFGVAVGDFGMIMKTKTGGIDWDVVSLAPSGTTLNDVSMYDEQNGTAVGVGGTVLRTNSGGDTWSDNSATPTVEFNGVSHLGGISAETWIVGDNGAIASFDDYSGAPMVIQPSGTTENLNGIDFFGQQGWLAGNNGTILVSSPSSTSIAWSPQTSGVSEDLSDIDFVDANNGWAVGTNGTILNTANGGSSWNPQTSNTTATLNSVSFADSQNGWVVGDASTILVTSDGGTTWSSQGFDSNTAYSSMFNYLVDGSAANPYIAKIDDINNDGKNDITFATDSGHIGNMRMGLGPQGKYLYRSSKQTVSAGGDLIADLTFLDYNDDGRPDIAVTNYQKDQVSILTQPVIPTNGFDLVETLDVGDSANTTATYSPIGIDAADINGDGLEDIVVANSDNNSISVFTKETAIGPFFPPAIFKTTGPAPYGLAIGDVNNVLPGNEIVVADSGPNGGNKIEVFSLAATPGAPIITSSTHPDDTVYYMDNKPQFDITPASDVDGLTGYYWTIDTSSNTVPTAADNFSASGSVSILAGQPDGDNYFHAVAVDSKGNIGNTVTTAAHFLFRINSTPIIATIQSPGDGSVISGTINIDATATTSPLFNINKVEIYFDGNSVPDVVLASEPYTYLWDTTGLSDGPHTVTIIAYDSGNRQATDTNSVTINNSSPGGGGGGGGSGVNQSSIEITGDQFISSKGVVSGLVSYDPVADTWNQSGYFRPGAVQSSAIYEFSLPSPSGYLWQQLTINEDPNVSFGEAAIYQAYNWATLEWDNISGNGELPFWYIEPGNNLVQIRVIAPTWSEHQIDKLKLDFKYQSDSVDPIVSQLSGSVVNFANPYFSRLTFSLSEKSFLNIVIRNSSNVPVRQIDIAKHEGIPAIYWDLKDDLGNPLPPDNYTFQVSATDVAGNAAASVFGLIEYRSSNINPFLALPLMSWDWSKIKSVSGDFNNDGKVDLAIMEDVGNNRTLIHQLTSTGASFAVSTVWDSGAGNWNQPATRIVAGDFNNDGNDDVVAIYGYGGAQTRAFMFASNGAMLTSPVQWWDSGPGNWSVYGSKIASGDFDGDGQVDLAFLYGYDGSRTRLFIAKSTGSSFKSPIQWWDSGPGNWDGPGSKLVTGDFDGDGKTDMGVLYGYSNARTKMWIFKSKGKGFNSPQAWWDSGPGNWDWNGSQVVAGDYNKDGISDFSILYSYGNVQTKVFAGISSGSGFNTPVEVWDSGPGNWAGKGSKLLSGDYSGDGLDDFVILYNYFRTLTGVWLMPM